MTTLTVGERAVAPASPPPQRAPNRVALTITGRPYVSYSQLSLMRACPKKFEFQYVLNAPKDFLPVSLMYGGAIHASLESFYRGRLEGIALSADDMKSAYHAAWRRNLDDAGGKLPVKFGVKEDESAVHALAERTIAAFLASSLAAPKGSVLGVEEELKVVLHPDLPDTLTRVDLVTTTDSALWVVDHKTSRSKWTAAKAQESSEQLQIYASAARGIAAQVGLPVKLAFAILTKAKAPQIQILPVATDAERISMVTTSALQTWSAIVAGNFYANPTPMNCSACPYRSRCPALGVKHN